MGSTLYLLDLFSDEIQGALSDTSSLYTAKDITGCYAIPYGLSLPLTSPPTSRADLLSKKHSGYLNSHPGFSNIVFDDCLDATGWDLTYPPTHGYFGERGSIRIDVAQTVIVPLASSPPQVVLNYDPFSVIDADPATGLCQRTYQEEPTTVFSVQASFDAGATFNPLLAGVVESIPLANQGNALILRFTSSLPTIRRGLAGWSLVY